MLPGPGENPRWARVSTAKPSQRASRAWTSNFNPLALCTKTGEPHVRMADRSGGRLYRASNGVLPSSERVAVRFFSQVACLSASPHNDLGRPLLFVNP